MQTLRNGLEFDADTHTYKVGDKPLPSVTTIIRTVLPGWQAAEWYLQRGRAIHHGCRLADEGRLDRSTVALEIAPRIAAWERFREESGATVTDSEQPLCHAVYQYAGTLDRILDIACVSAICDLKSTIEAQVRLQLGAYSLLWENNTGWKLGQGVAVQLNDDASYRTLWLSAAELRTAERQFLSVLTVFGFMKTHNLKGNADA